MRNTLNILIFALAVSACQKSEGVAAKHQDTAKQARANLYQCEGCEGALEQASVRMTYQTRIGPGIDRGEPLDISGVVFHTDRKTPASGVIIYAYQTNAQGLYANGTSQTEAARRHGRLRGWVRTGPDGRYSFITIKPAPYPNDNIPAHIHLTILEPGKRPYWIDDIVFDGEYGVTQLYRNSMTNKGGNGIVKASLNARNHWVVQRDIILEKHPQ